MLAGERIVLFRGEGDRPGALIDRCPHRGVSLGLGRVHEDGTLACPFHGWRFAPDGSCTHVPLNPTVRCETMRATALPVYEAGGLIWVHTDPGSVHVDPPALDESLVEPRFARTSFIQDWSCHWTRAMENMLDFPHLPFVHASTIGASLARTLRPDSEMKVDWSPEGDGWTIRASQDGQADEGYLQFTRPNRMTLHIPIPGRRLRLHVFCVPAEARRTRMILLSSRDFLGRLPLGALLNAFNARVALQDQAIVESSEPWEVPAPGLERSVPSDGPTLAFRRYYFDHLRDTVANLGT
jgi:phenylpropionate dioxygenase-like ring-hydroxylating dioxygenase large terminal subunit